MLRDSLSTDCDVHLLAEASTVTEFKFLEFEGERDGEVVLDISSAEGLTEPEPSAETLLDTD